MDEAAIAAMLSNAGERRHEWGGHVDRPFGRGEENNLPMAARNASQNYFSLSESD